MSKKASRNATDYIVPLSINRLEGRMLHMPAPATKSKSVEILFIYGHHSSLERWWGVVQVLNRYAAVTMPDLPGFGGMDSFYTIGKKPTIDNMADYLAAFVKMRYKRKKVAIAGMSFGFVVATRMLQRYPELTKKVVLMISVVGFTHFDEFVFSKSRHRAYLLASQVIAKRLPATIFRYTALNSRVLKTFYAKTHNAKHKFAQAKDKDEVEMLKEVEVGLWQDNDVQTWAYTSTEFLKLNNCLYGKIDLPVWHVAAKADHFFDNYRVEQHMRIIYKDFHKAEYDMSTHAPSVIADEKAAASLVPPKLRRVLRKLS